MHAADPRFRTLNPAYNRVFRPGVLSLGLVVPIERYPASRAPTMHAHLERVQLAEALGFSSIWLRDVPFDVPAFGDAGQLYDPWVYLGFLAAKTQRIALGVSSIILPLRHPAHVAKAAASVDQLSSGRLLLGIASGDRPSEYPAMNLSYSDRGQRFRDSYAYIRAVGQSRPSFANALASERGPDAPLFVSVNPGSMLGSKMVKDAFGVPGRDIQIGAQILAQAATDSSFASANGLYFDNDSGRFAPPHPQAHDPDVAGMIVTWMESWLKRAL